MFAVRIHKRLSLIKHKQRIKLAGISLTSKHFSDNHMQPNTTMLKNHVSNKINVTQDPTGELEESKAIPTEKQWVYDQNGARHLLAKSNSNFEAYYSAQSTCPSESEWQDCLAAMRRELPQGFRVDLQRAATSKQIIKLLKQMSHSIELSKSTDTNNLIFRQKSWCEQDSIWQLIDVGRWKLKSNASLDDISSQNFLNFLYHENELGRR